MALPFHHTVVLTRPLIVVPPPILRYSSVGPDKAVYQKSGNLVTGMTVSTGQTFTANYTIGTQIDNAHNGAEVLLLEYGAWLQQNGVLPEGMYGNGARDFYAVFEAPAQNREVFGYGADTSAELAHFDLVSLPTHGDPEARGLGIHQRANRGTLPNIPSRPGIAKVWTGYNPTGGPTLELPGRLDITDGVSSNLFDFEFLITGALSPALRRGLSIGMGSFGVIGSGGLGEAPTLRMLYLDVWDVKLTPAERAKHTQNVRLLLNL